MGGSTVTIASDFGLGNEKTRFASKNHIRTLFLVAEPVSLFPLSLSSSPPLPLLSPLSHAPMPFVPPPPQYHSDVTATSLSSLPSLLSKLTSLLSASSSSPPGCIPSGPSSTTKRLSVLHAAVQDAPAATITLNSGKLLAQLARVALSGSIESTIAPPSAEELTLSSTDEVTMIPFLAEPQTPDSYSYDSLLSLRILCFLTLVPSSYSKLSFLLPQLANQIVLDPSHELLGLILANILSLSPPSVAPSPSVTSALLYSFQISAASASSLSVDHLSHARQPYAHLPSDSASFSSIGSDLTFKFSSASSSSAVSISLVLTPESFLATHEALEKQTCR